MKNIFQMDIKTNLHSTKTFDNNLVPIHKIKPNLILNKPAYAGMCVLELSKVLMCEFHYEYIKSKYSNKSWLLSKDKDSLKYETKTEIIHDNFSKEKELYDLVIILLN